MTFLKIYSSPRFVQRAFIGSCAAVALTACSNPLDFDLRGLTNSGFDTAQAAQQANTTSRPAPDENGVISYPTYQVAVTRKGDTVNTVANRLGLSASELARYNGVPENVALNSGEVIALPQRITSTAQTASGSSGAISSAQPINVTTLANEALGTPATSSTATPVRTPRVTTTASSTSGSEPVRHQVKRGETAYSIARTYDVSVRSLSDWNGLGSDLAVQEGRYLLIPVKSDNASLSQPLASTPLPGTGSTTPTPPSAARPLPDASNTTPVPATPIAAAPNLGATQSSSAEMLKPVSGPIIRDYDKTKSKFILFSAPEGTTVKAAKSGTVKLVSTNADGVQIMVIDHGDGLQSAYSFIDDLAVKKGDSVSKGQSIAKVTANEFNALQFLVFKGTQTVDPAPFLN